MEGNKLKISFSFTDEFGQESALNKTFTSDTLEVTPQFDLLVEEFKRFLLATGFGGELVNQIQVIENDMK